VKHVHRHRRQPPSIEHFAARSGLEAPNSLLDGKIQGILARLRILSAPQHEQIQIVTGQNSLHIGTGKWCPLAAKRTGKSREFFIVCKALSIEER